jgi:hypothetical protein
MWWQYLITIIASLFIALSAVWVDHRLSGRSEYRKAIIGVKAEVTMSISICTPILEMIDEDIDANKKSKLKAAAYPLFQELAWDTWKSVIYFRNSNLAQKIEPAYLSIHIANNLLNRIEESKWGGVVTVSTIIDKERQMESYKHTKRYISDELLPLLKDTREPLEREISKDKGWIKRFF